MTLDYLDQVAGVLAHIRTSQTKAIERAAEWITNSLRQGGMLHVFGAAHSSLVVAEMFYRAGGLVPVNPITDPNLNVLTVPPSKGTCAERLPGYGTLVLEAYDLRPGEVLIVASQSGKNATTLEIATGAQGRGLKVVAITSLAHSRAVEASGPNGKKLYEVADLVIDTGAPLGDAAVTVHPDWPRVAALSNVAGLIIVNALAAQVAANYAALGEHPPIWVSSNVPGGDRENAAARRAYVSRLKPA